MSIKKYQHWRDTLADYALIFFGGVLVLLGIVETIFETGLESEIPQITLALVGGIAAVIGLALVTQLFIVRQWAVRFANDTRSINDGDVAAAHWIAANIPPGAIVGANDIGAIAYWGEHDVFDIVGLASPEAISLHVGSNPRSAAGGDEIISLLQANNVQYIAIFPFWFPELGGTI